MNNLRLLVALHTGPPVDQDVASLNRRLSPEWCRQAPLTELLTGLHALHTADPGLVDGERLGITVRRLVEAEAAPGGPYHEAGSEPDLITNLAVLCVAGWAAGPLPQTAAFVEAALAATTPWPAAACILAAELPALWPSVEPHLHQAALTPALRRLISGYAGKRASKAMPADTLLPAASHTGPADAAIFTTAAAQFTMFGEDIAAQAAALLSDMNTANRNHEITLLPQYFAEALQGPAASAASAVAIHQLGVANLLTWTAYTIYDHILDGEAYRPQLPLAVIARQLAVNHYKAACPDIQSASYVDYVFSRMDRANAWEAAHARGTVRGHSVRFAALPEYGDFSQLAWRSYGHVLGPVILAYRQSALSEAQRRLIGRAFHHYLIARQLNDDVHDWQDDLAAGQLTAVVSKLLAAQGISRRYDLQTITPRLRHVFWEQAADEIAARIASHATSAREALSASHAVTAKNTVFQLFDHVSTVADRSRQAKAHDHAFLRAFSA